ncbi:glycine--tRNA ligase [Candidatus Woesearchaeota archaeon]|nr:glycine--tRNA ligase [Candidatus Woesearchaeota archaeon]
MSISMEELAVFCKKKGFVYPSSEIYGGIAGFWDFGPLGVELFNNIKSSFWKFFVNSRDNVIGIEASVISHPRTWKASGHVANFSDVAVVCKKCNFSTKIDKSEIGKVKCEKCGSEYDVKGEFSLMFKTKVGALDTFDAYLRGETAQGMFLDFKVITDTARVKLPFGILQIGRCFRNEIAPRDFLFRSREFNIGEFEFFIHPKETKCKELTKEQLSLKIPFLSSEMQNSGKNSPSITTVSEILKAKKLDEWHAYWLAEQMKWFASIGLAVKNLKVREHTKHELSHYSTATFDIDYNYPIFGSEEIAGIANRGQFDLNQHMKESGKDLSIFDEETKEKVVPRVIEPTFGMERIFLAAICEAYEFDKKRENVVLHLHPKLAPYKVAVFPLMKKDGLDEAAKKIHDELKQELNSFYDVSGSIGRRYARQDEIGTPYCITVDYDSLKNKDITIRDRDSTEQKRIKINNVREIVRKLINQEIDFKSLK